MRLHRKQAMQDVMDSVAGEIAEQFERRIEALEAHITDLEDRLNERGVFSGDAVYSAVTESTV